MSKVGALLKTMAKANLQYGGSAARDKERVYRR